MLFRQLVVAALPYLAAASPLAKRWDDFVVKHAWSQVPRGWVYHSPADPAFLLDMRIALKSHRMDELITQLYEVSDPKHHKYGQHLSKADVEALVAPHPESLVAVDSWLRHHGFGPADVVHRSGGGDWLSLSMTVSQAETMLSTKYNVYMHPGSEEYVVRTLSYSLPRELHAHIDLVTPTTYFGTMRAMRATSFLQPDIKPTGNSTLKAAASPDAVPPASCATFVTPACLQTLYNTDGFTPSNPNSQSIGIAGYLGEFQNRADTQTFLGQFAPLVPSDFTVDTVLVNGGGDDQDDPGVEANLDVQYVIGMAAPIKITYFSTGGSPPFIPDGLTPTNTNEPYLDWLNFVLSQPKIANVFSTSYGDDEQTVPLDYQLTVCNLFAQLGARGASVLFSSGDFGHVYILVTTNLSSDLFQPMFPASCPFVTTVGGTRGIPETTVFFSGGGFSNTFARPLYQSDAVSAYLDALGDTIDPSLFNATGRAYPDISALALGFQVVIGGAVHSVGGTSASCPTSAGIVALLNDVRISNGDAPLGFLNPLLYSTGAAGFNDITTGSNPGCGTDGFPALAGWDPATGLGTPDFVKLREIFN
ncbi:hypothetical protein ONZ45_g4995 [Pleurotus djamor]|nr:hypothetical protein ONZ45_g4995 [Pleurotus djamor]